MNSIHVCVSYKDASITTHIELNASFGVIQEHILNICKLMIYNIEYCKIIINDNECMIGSTDYPFQMKLNEFLEVHQINCIHTIIIVDRTRDINGNVIQYNEIIDNYHHWYQERESENYLNYLNQPLDTSHIYQQSNTLPTYYNNVASNFNTNETNETNILNQFQTILSEEINTIYSNLNHTNNINETNTIDQNNKIDNNIDNTENIESE